MKKNLTRYVLWKIWNFALIFYVMSVLHKKSKQSLRPSTGRIGWDFFSKIDILSAKVYTKKVLNFEIVWLTPGKLRPLTVKGVYLVSHSLVCESFWDGVYLVQLWLLLRKKSVILYLFLLEATGALLVLFLLQKKEYPFVLSIIVQFVTSSRSKIHRSFII